jgi:hypothetical protein
MQQITVGGVHLDHAETGGQRAFGGGNEGLDHFGDLRFVQLPGLRVLRVEGDRRRPDRLQPPSSGLTLPCLPIHGRWVLALRPAWAS